MAAMARKRLMPAATAISTMTRRVGIMRTANLLSFLVEWAMALDANDWEPITLADYEEWAGVRRAAAYKRQALYRQVFDDLNPNERLIAARAQMQAERPDATPEDIAASLLLAPAA